jgi:hypothetical protein
MDAFIKYGANENNVKKSEVPKTFTVAQIAKNRKKSPILLNRRAFKPAFAACILVVQKLTSKKEHNPTPSHPKNKTKRLLE